MRTDRFRDPPARFGATEIAGGDGSRTGRRSCLQSDAAGDDDCGGFGIVDDFRAGFDWVWMVLAESSDCEHNSDAAEGYFAVQHGMVSISFLCLDPLPLSSILGRSLNDTRV